MTPPVVVEVPIATVSEANSHTHWRGRQKRAGTQRLVVKQALAVAAGRNVPAFPVVVVIERRSPRPLDDDNLAGALKHVRDGVADFLRVNDRDPRVRWHTTQRKGKGSVRVVVRERELVDDDLDNALWSVLSWHERVALAGEPPVR